MSFSESVRTCMRKFFVASGRASRSEFWWFQLFFFIAVSLPMSICFILPDLEALGFALVALAILVLLVPAFCVQIRRYHDVGYSGFIILVNFIPYVGSIILLVMQLLPSKPDNKYGPKPFSGKKQEDCEVKEVIDVEI